MSIQALRIMIPDRNRERKGLNHDASNDIFWLAEEKQNSLLVKSSSSKKKNGKPCKHMKLYHNPAKAEGIGEQAEANFPINKSRSNL